MHLRVLLREEKAANTGKKRNTREKLTVEIRGLLLVRGEHLDGGEAADVVRLSDSLVLRHVDGSDLENIFFRTFPDD